jgi:hypothetical protein
MLLGGCLKFVRYPLTEEEEEEEEILYFWAGF